MLEAYNQGHLSRGEIEKTLGISKTRFFAITKRYRTNPEIIPVQIPLQKLLSYLVIEKAIAEEWSRVKTDVPDLIFSILGVFPLVIGVVMTYLYVRKIMTEKESVEAE